MSGIDLLREIRATQNPIPFGFVTSESSKGTYELAKSEGAAFLICKPFTPEDLEEALSSILGGS
jgi:two-component system chemotaxis response regulator CheY